MNIQHIKVIDRKTIIVTTIDGDPVWFHRDELDTPHQTWFDNILACASSLMIETPNR
jgi:hypothetical protein